MSRAKIIVMMLLVDVGFFVLLEVLLRLAGAPGLMSSTFFPLHNAPAFMGRFHKQIDAKTGYADADNKPPVIGFFGASTVAGVPSVTWSPCHLLEAKLGQGSLKRQPVVINGGLTGESSTLIAEAACRAIATGKLDLVIWYTGNNEWLDTNAHRTLLLHQPGWRGASERCLHEWRTLQVFANLLRGRAPWVANIPLFSPMKKFWAYSDEWNLLLWNYRQQLERVIRTCRKHETPLIICTVVCNIRDATPGELYGVELTTRDALSTEEERVFAARLSQHAELDAPTASYHTGQAFLAEGNDRLASYALRLAKDYCSHVNRVPELCNELIRFLARQHDVPLCDLALVFDQHSPHGLTGHELVYDWMHPSEAGVTLMTDTLAEFIATQGYFGSTLPGAALLHEQELAERLGYSALEQGNAYLVSVYSSHQDQRWLEPHVVRKYLQQARASFERDQRLGSEIPAVQKVLELLDQNAALTQPLRAEMEKLARGEGLPESVRLHQERRPTAVLIPTPQPYQGQPIVWEGFP